MGYNSKLFHKIAKATKVNKNLTNKWRMGCLIESAQSSVEELKELSTRDDGVCFKVEGVEVVSV